MKKILNLQFMEIWTEEYKVSRSMRSFLFNKIIGYKCLYHSYAVAGGAVLGVARGHRVLGLALRTFSLSAFQKKSVSVS